MHERFAVVVAVVSVVAQKLKFDSFPEMCRNARSIGYLSSGSNNLFVENSTIQLISIISLQKHKPCGL
jgi:hypothetical protein